MMMIEFIDWWKSHGRIEAESGSFDAAEAAWDHQGSRIAELEARIKEQSETWQRVINTQYVPRIEQLDAKLKATESTLQQYARYGNEAAMRRDIQLIGDEPINYANSIGGRYDSVCAHNWVSADNKLVSGLSICTNCKELRATDTIGKE